ncbi:uncharacterized protein LOC110093312 [Dendrobium catenatum]|uniref:Transmembrane protein n=1 Tax=Dendrobium catenatum TaxID=906689 RepID=A0A2I0WK42_9ASPA|nr:uncharacterized protein LOC110093312 [Dendrobium catenatum]PKU76016.1 hypothetical protein MA16_Dca006063 [Dendrobium catenatum]
MSRPTVTEKVFAISIVLLAMISPLYIGKKAAEEDEDEENRSLSFWLPLLLILLISCISLTCFMDQRFLRFDPYWIHRVGGSSCGIFTFLLVLGFVLKCKASFGT